MRLKDLPPEQRKRVQEAKRAAGAMDRQTFQMWCGAAGLPKPEPEFRFHPKRAWRFDFAWPDAKVALEVEGGAFSGGRHTRGSGFREDLAKYSEAAALGWRIVRTLPEDQYSGVTLDRLRRAVAGPAST